MQYTRSSGRIALAVGVLVGLETFSPVFVVSFRIYRTTSQGPKLTIEYHAQRDPLEKAVGLLILDTVVAILAYSE